MSRLCLLLIMAALLSGVAEAGQRRQAAEEPSPMDSMNIEEIRAYQGYFYPTGGRDPLVMRLPTDRERGLGKKTGPTKAPTIEEQETMMRAWLEEITIAIRRQDYEAALTVTAQAINIIDNEWPPLKSEHIQLLRMNESIRNYARMAVRLKTQQDIGREFSALRLRVDGVTWSPSDSKTVVNGRTLSAGEVMLAERKQGDLRVESIEPTGVVFQYRGMRFRLPVELYAPLEDERGEPDADE